MKRIYLLTVFYLFTSFVYAGQWLQSGFLHMGTEDGLSNDRITAIAQDSLGFIWIGTKHGLNRYDGAQYKVYAPEKNNFPAHDISVLYLDRKYRLWVGTIGEGLYLYDPAKDRFERIPLGNRPSYIEIHDLWEENNGRLWIATEKGLYSYHTVSENAEFYRQEIGRASESGKNNILAMAGTSTGQIWLGTFGAGLYIFDLHNRTFAPFDSADSDLLSLRSDYINALCWDRDGNLLAGTNENGLKRIDLYTGEITDYLAGTPYEAQTIIRFIQPDKQHGQWVGTDGSGLLHLEPAPEGKVTVRAYQHDPRISGSLSSNTVNAFLVDRQSNQWIGTGKKGVDVMKKDPDSIAYYYSDGKGENKLPVLSVYRNGKELWMGTDGEGITRIALPEKKAKILNKTFPDRYTGDFVQCIKSARTGAVWIGTYERGIYLLDPRTGEKRNISRHPDGTKSLPHNDVRDLLELPDGSLWIATWGGGIAYLDTETWTTRIFKNNPADSSSLPNDNILKLYQDEKGRLWLASYGGGLIVFDPAVRKFRSFKTDRCPGLASNFIFALLPDGNRTLWLGTKEGLCRLDMETLQFETIPIEADYSSRTIQSLLQDNNGDIWAATKKGLLHLQKGNKKTEFLPGIFDSFSLNSAFKDEEGILYFGGEERVVAVDPSRIRFNDFKSQVYLTNLLLFNNPVPVGPESVLKHQICYEKEITLRHSQSVITIEYATLDFPSSHNINYEVMLEGFEKEWRNVGNQKTATFTNLYPGKYTFKVRPVSDLFTHEIVPAQIDIRILPPFWLTWWAFVAYAGILVFIFYLFRIYTLNWASIRNELKLEKIKREQEERMHQLKQRLFINISHDIRTPLTLIAGSVNKLFHKNGSKIEEQKNLMTIKANTTRLLNLTEELLNYRRLETGHVRLQVSCGNLVELVREIYVCYSQFAFSRKIEYEWYAADTVIYAWIDKVQLEKAVSNLLSNAFKFTPDGGKIKVEVALEESQQILIRVTDTGKGIAPANVEHIFDRFYQVEKKQIEKKTGNVGFGIGLSIAREIVWLHGGTIRVRSEEGRGSEFSILLKSGKEHLTNVSFVDSSSREALFPEMSERNTPVHTPDPALSSAQEEIAAAEPEEKEYSILIVEDNDQIRAYLTELFSSRYYVQEAENGRVALDRAIEMMPDLVVSDVMMPVMDGITFCHELKTDMRISHIPVILLTARTLPESVVEGFETGADEYLTKPFHEQILLARVKNILENRQELRKRIRQEMILNPRELDLNTQDDLFLTKLVRFIEDHLADPEFNIVQMASEMAMSHSNLYKKVKALTGLTVIGFIKDFRLKQAARLLVRGELNITEISYQVGYSERRHFTLDFKKKFNLTPTEYAAKYKDTLVE